MLALGVLVAGCGQATPTTSRVGQVRQQVGAPAAPKSAAQTPAGNRQAARREAARLLSLTKVPPGAVTTTAHPSSLDGPALGMAAAASLVDQTRFWRVSTDLASTIAWFRAHPPHGLTAAGSSSGGGPAYRGQPAYQMVGVGYSERDRPGMQELGLAIGVATLPGGGSAIRADGMAIWLDPRPLRDTRAGTRLRVTVDAGCPTRDAGYVGVRPTAGGDGQDLDSRLLPAAAPTAALACDYAGMNGRHEHQLLRTHILDASAAHKLAKAVAGLALGHPVGEIMHCPFADGTATVLAFSYDGRDDVDLWVERNGCAVVSNGRIMTRVGNLGTTLTAAEKASD